MKYAGTLIAIKDMEKGKGFSLDELGPFVAQGLSPEQIAFRMNIPLESVVSSLNSSK